MASLFSFCNVPMMPVRSEPNHRAEQTTQLLFGEKAEILEVNSRDWAHIRCAWDGYEGWCKYSQLTEISRRDYNKPTKQISANHLGRIVFEGSEMPVPMGSELAHIKTGKLSPALLPGQFKGKKVSIAENHLSAEAVKAAALQYMHAPYLWGGRSLAGIDCSGLVQMAYKFSNYALPRDASQQANKGMLIEFLQNAECGDLAFFDDKDGHIVHVGLLLDNQNILHATDSSGRVVIDRIDLGGIVSVSLRKRTHNLRVVKRIIGHEQVNDIPEGLFPGY